MVGFVRSAPELGKNLIVHVVVVERVETVAVVCYPRVERGVESKQVIGPREHMAWSQEDRYAMLKHS